MCAGHGSHRHVAAGADDVDSHCVIFVDYRKRAPEQYIPHVLTWNRHGPKSEIERIDLGFGGAMRHRTLPFADDRYGEERMTRKKTMKYPGSRPLSRGIAGKICVRE